MKIINYSICSFLDLKKAFDRVLHLVIWRALQKYSVPEHLVDLVKELYVDTNSAA